MIEAVERGGHTVQRFGEDERALHDRLGVQCEALGCEFAAVVAAGNCRLDIRFERPRVQHDAVGAGLTDGGMRHIGFLNDRAGVAGGLGDRVGEQGFPQFKTITWNGLMAPAHTPKPVIDRLAAELAAAEKEPAVLEHMANQGIDPAGQGPAHFTETIKTDVALWTEAIKAAGVKQK